MRVAAINLVVADQPSAAENLSADWTYTDTEGALHDFNLEVRQWDGFRKAESWGCRFGKSQGGRR